MPFKHEHAFRIKDPGQYDSFARKNIDSGIDIVLGIKGDKSETQAYRFKKDKFTPEQAEKWMADHDIKYISFEEASDSGEDDEDKKTQSMEGDDVSLQAGGPGSGRHKGSGNVSVSSKKVKKVKLPKKFTKYGKTIGSLPASVFTEYKAWVKKNWGS